MTKKHHTKGLRITEAWDGERQCWLVIITLGDQCITMTLDDLVDSGVGQGIVDDAKLAERPPRSPAV